MPPSALKALEENGMSAEDVTIVNTPTDETPQVLASGSVDAIAAWQPNSGQALKSLPGSKPSLLPRMLLESFMTYFAYPLKVWRLIRKIGIKLSLFGTELWII